MRNALDKSYSNVLCLQLECCGAVSVNDYDNSTWQTKQQPGVSVLIT